MPWLVAANLRFISVSLRYFLLFSVSLGYLALFCVTLAVNLAVISLGVGTQKPWRW